MSQRDLFYIGLLVIVVIVAFYVNRRRDAKGQISFIDKNKMGVVGIIIHALEDEEKTGSWYLPLWIPNNRLIFDVSLLLPKGAYGAEAYWENFIHKPVLALFEKEPADSSLKLELLSEMRQFSLPHDTAVQFLVNASGKRFSLTSPTIIAETKDDLAFPILINDPDLNKTAVRLAKDRSRKIREILEIPLVDGKISGKIYDDMKILQRKNDLLTVQNRELQVSLDQAVQGKLNK